MSEEKNTKNVIIYLYGNIPFLRFRTPTIK
jgi:hypothetical protein